MYRESTWADGFYIDNHQKYRCVYCGKEFIVGEKLLSDCSSGFPICPYCGQANTECIACTENDQLPELESDMGCLAIYVDEHI